jgi:hypothetical protein
MRLNTFINKWLMWLILAFGLTLVTTASLFAHCDWLDGPVVKAAQKALDTRKSFVCAHWGSSEGRIRDSDPL